MNRSLREITIPLLLLVLILVFVGWLWFRQTSTGQDAKQQAKTSQSKVADWQTYANTETGFEIKFPPGFAVLDNPSGIQFAEEKFKEQKVQSPLFGIEIIRTPLGPEGWVDQNVTGIDGTGQKFDIDKRSAIFGNTKFLMFLTRGASGQNDNALIQAKSLLDGSLMLINIYRHTSGLGEIPLQTYQQMLSSFKFVSEIAKLQDYNSGQDILGFSLNTPSGWVVKFKELPLPFSGMIKRFQLDFVPQGAESSDLRPWGGLFVSVHNVQSDINRWVDTNLQDLKSTIIVEDMPDIGGKKAYRIDDTEGRTITFVILGNQYSYSYGFYQDGATNFPQRIISEIFPNINIK